MKKIIIIISILIPVIYFLVVHYLIDSVAENEPQQDADYVIVLGAKVNGTTMSLSLYNRAIAALAYLKENPKAKVICTGGQGPGEDITEAEALASFLIEKGIDEKRIIKEDESTSTFENLKFAKALMENKQAQVVIVSNDFHLYRARLIANRQGLRADTLPAETPAVVKPQSWIREYLAVGKTILFDR